MTSADPTSGPATESGWDWFDGGPGTPEDGGPDASALPATFARCFRGPDGDAVLAYLRAITLDRALGPSVGDAALRHVEGQRQLVAHVLTLVARGRRGA